MFEAFGHILLILGVFMLGALKVIGFILILIGLSLGLGLFLRFLRNDVGLQGVRFFSAIMGILLAIALILFIAQMATGSVAQWLRLTLPEITKSDTIRVSVIGILLLCGFYIGATD